MLAGCTGELSTLDPAGPRAENLATLWWVMFFGAAVLFGLVLALFALVYLRPHWAQKITPRQWIIGGGLILPIPVLTVLTGTALFLGEQLLPKGDAPLVIGVEAQQWAWTISYPAAPNMPESSTLHIPSGVPVDLEITSRDVIHSFWIPRLGGKIDAIPGKTNRFRIEASKPGVYWGTCAEYCGIGHDTMQMRVEAHTPEDFAALMETAP
ncbi:cytochrome c oxidase subunit II [Devosia sp. MC532]|uniref:cytochrome c oxidase subunit II n=1 Tax=Devosia sp. MC532 TaxID=2799788 RepID=UPI0032C0E21D